MRCAPSGHRGAVVVDAALMLDWGLERECDAVLAVVATEAHQVVAPDALARLGARPTRARGWRRSAPTRRFAPRPTK